VNTVTRFLCDDRGSATRDYAIIAALAALAVVAAGFVFNPAHFTGRPPS